MTPTEGTKSTRSKGKDADSSHSLFTDLLRRATTPELLAGVAGAAAAAHFTKHAVDRSNDDEPEDVAESESAEATEGEQPEDEQPEESEDEQPEEPEDEQPEEPEDEQPEEPEDEQPEEPEDEQPEEPEDEEPEEPEAEQDEEPEDEEPEEPEAESEEVAEDAADMQADDETSDEAQSSNGSLRDDDERMQLLARARAYAEEFTGHPVESVSGFASEKKGWRVGVEVVEVARVPSTTDVLASYEVVLDGDGDLVDFRRAGRYYRNAVDGDAG